MQFISVENLLVIKDVIRLIGCRETFVRYGLPAALSTNDPKQQVQVTWKSPLCRKIEAQKAAAEAAAAALHTEATA